MSIASFCSSLPAGPCGFKDGRGTRYMVQMSYVVPGTAKPPAQACRLVRWNKYHCAAVLTNSPPPTVADIPTDPSQDVEIVFDLEPFLVEHKGGRIERLGRFGNTSDYIEASPDLITGVKSKDVVTKPNGVKMRLYFPKVEESPPKKLPVLVYCHGGAFIVEDSASPPYHCYLESLAEEANILIVSVNYRLAPEHPLPAAYDDCMEALNWVDWHSGRKGQEEKYRNFKQDDWIKSHGDLSRLFLSGDSAGGNITHNVAIHKDNKVKLEGIALVHPYFFGKKPLETERQDPANLLLHKKLWSFIAPESKGLDDPRVDPLGESAPSLRGLKCKRAVVFVAGDDFHGERAELYNEKLKKEFPGKVSDLCKHKGVGHVYHLSVDGTEDHTDSETAWKLMTDLLKFYKDNGVVLDDSFVKSLKEKTVHAILQMRFTGREMSEMMMKQLVAFYNDKPVPFSSEVN